MVLEGQVGEIKPLRHTPAGFPVLEFVLIHESTRKLGLGERHIQFEMPVLLIGDTVHELDKLQVLTQLKVEGYVQPRSLKFRQLVLHAERIELIERK